MSTLSLQLKEKILEFITLSEFFIENDLELDNDNISSMINNILALKPTAINDQSYNLSITATDDATISALYSNFDGEITNKIIECLKILSEGKSKGNYDHFRSNLTHSHLVDHCASYDTNSHLNGRSSTATDSTNSQNSNRSLASFLGLNHHQWLYVLGGLVVLFQLTGVLSSVLGLYYCSFGYSQHEIYSNLPEFCGFMGFVSFIEFCRYYSKVVEASNEVQNKIYQLWKPRILTIFLILDISEYICFVIYCSKNGLFHSNFNNPTTYLTVFTYILDFLIAYFGSYAIMGKHGFHLETYFILCTFVLVEILFLFLHPHDGHLSHILFVYVNIKTTLIVYEVYADKYWFQQCVAKNNEVSTWTKNIWSRNILFIIYIIGKFLYQLDQSLLLDFMIPNIDISSASVGKIMELSTQVYMLYDYYRKYNTVEKNVDDNNSNSNANINERGESKEIQDSHPKITSITVSENGNTLALDIQDPLGQV